MYFVGARPKHGLVNENPSNVTAGARGGSRTGVRFLCKPTHPYAVDAADGVCSRLARRETVGVGALKYRIQQNFTNKEFLCQTDIAGIIAFWEICFQTVRNYFRYFMLIVEVVDRWAAPSTGRLHPYLSAQALGRQP